MAMATGRRPIASPRRSIPPEGAWVHAYLHRKEGDRTNALYWYRRAGRSMLACDLPSEWEIIVRHLLGMTSEPGETGRSRD